MYIQIWHVIICSRRDKNPGVRRDFRPSLTLGPRCWGSRRAPGFSAAIFFGPLARLEKLE